MKGICKQRSCLPQFLFLGKMSNFHQKIMRPTERQEKDSQLPREKQSVQPNSNMTEMTDYQKRNLK